MNHTLLNKIKKIIINNPKAFDMLDWWQEEDDCGTAACIAGWACNLSGWTRDLDDSFQCTKGDARDSVPEVAQRELGLNRIQAVRLFYPGRWPAELMNRYDSGDKTAAVDMIELIQAEDAA